MQLLQVWLVCSNLLSYGCCLTWWWKSELVQVPLIFQSTSSCLYLSVSIQISPFSVIFGRLFIIFVPLPAFISHCSFVLSLIPFTPTPKSHLKQNYKKIIVFSKVVPSFILSFQDFVGLYCDCCGLKYLILRQLFKKLRWKLFFDVCICKSRWVHRDLWNQC